MENQVENQVNKTAYQTMMDYLNSLTDKYKNIILQILSNTPSESEMKSIQLFANIQDSAYIHEHVIANKESLADDIFEILIGLDKPDATDEEFCVRMHDAWALSYMYRVYTEGVPAIDERKIDNVQDENVIKLDNDNFDNFINKESKSYFSIDFYGLEIDENGRSNIADKTMIVKWKRLKQFIDYSNLSSEEKLKDKVPMLVFKLLQEKLQKAFSGQEGGRRRTEKVSFIKNRKKMTRKVQLNKRGKKCVQYNGELILLSKLKLV